MRTKALLVSAVLAVAGVATSVAQVYSVNAVGYINLTLKPGFQMIANQLDNGAGNQVVDLLKGLPEGTILYKWGAAGYTLNTFEFEEWGDPAMTLEPGEGAFIRLPAGADVTVTLVGEVPQGSLSRAVPAGFWIVSSQVPQAGTVSALGFPASDGDLVYKFSNATGAFTIYTYDFGSWDPSDPQMSVGESFFSRAGVAKTWTRTFSVNN